MYIVTRQSCLLAYSIKAVSKEGLGGHRKLTPVGPSVLSFKQYATGMARAACGSPALINARLVVLIHQ